MQLCDLLNKLLGKIFSRFTSNWLFTDLRKALLLLSSRSFLTSAVFLTYTELKVLCFQTQFLKSPTQRNVGLLFTALVFDFQMHFFCTVHIYTIQAQAMVNFPGKKLVEG